MRRTWSGLGATSPSFSGEEREQAKWGPFDEQKAILASVASLLKPGRTMAASLADHQWVGDETRHLPMLAELLCFLRALVTTEARVAPPASS